MNFSPSECLLGRQRCRQWIPLISQQVRLRHIYQIIGYNFYSKSSGSFYYTLHLTTMSAPFYTSEKAEGPNAKWAEMDIRNLVNTSISALVLRVWQEMSGESDIIALTLGINFSGLVYLGNKISDILPTYFEENTILLLMRGGYFTSYSNIRANLEKPPPFFEHLNVKDSGKIYKVSAAKFHPSEVRTSYNIEKLRRLHSLEIAIKNKVEDVLTIREKTLSKTEINQNSNQSLSSSLSSQNVRYEPQMLTMNSLNKMLQVKPTKHQRQEMLKTKKEIELLRFRNKLLSREKDLKSVLVRQQKQQLVSIIDKNEERNSELMQHYHQLNKEKEKLKEFQKNILLHRDVYFNTYSQLQHRRRQLLQELLFIYPIQQMSDKKYTIHGVYLPTSDVLADCSDPGLSVALGYITHVLIMCSMFLQVPLRYPLTHYGSRSYITDPISPVIVDKEKDFPLFTKGKEKFHFTYAVYLLNKNISQLRWTFQMNTTDLKATLPNLLTFLEAKDVRPIIPFICSLDTRSDLLENYNTLNNEQPLHLNCFDLSANFSDPLLDTIRQEHQKSSDLLLLNSCSSRTSTSSSNNNKIKTKQIENGPGPGLSEILAIPEAFLNKLITPDYFKNYVANGRSNNLQTTSDDNNSVSKPPYWEIAIKNENQPDSSCDIINENDTLDVSIEQGEDTLDPSLDFDDFERTKPIDIKRNSVERNIKYDCPMSRSADLDEETDKIKSINLTSSLKDELYFNGKSSSSDKINNSHESPLTVRTDALLATNSFNLVRPKH